jgi:NADH dehydrogenase
MDILITGGDGFVGRTLSRTLDDRGHSVTALSRAPDPEVLPADVATVSGDVTDPASIKDAFAGKDAVVNLVSLSPLFEPSGGNTQHERIHTRGTEHCLAAAADNDVDRFVQMSALGADPDGPTHYIRAKGKADELVKDADRDWVILRPSVIFGEGGEFVSFTEKLTTPYLTGLPGGGSSRFQPIHVAEMAAILADAVEADEHVGNIYEIGGPEKLTLAEVARLAHRARGRSLRILPVPMALAKVGLTVAGGIPGIPMGPDQYRSLQFDNTTNDNDVAAFGLNPDKLTTLSEYLSV